MFLKKRKRGTGGLCSLILSYLSSSVFTIGLHIPHSHTWCRDDCVHPSGKNSRDTFGASLPLHRLARSWGAGNHRAPHRLQTSGQRTHGPVLQTLPHCGSLQVWRNAHITQPPNHAFQNCFQTHPTWSLQGFSQLVPLCPVHSALGLDARAPS